MELITALPPSEEDPAPTLGGGTLISGAQPEFDEDEHQAGDTIGRYVVVQCIGAGGMGRVYRARDPGLDREVAVKLLRKTGEVAEVRLLREAQIMARISDPHVVPVFDVGECHGSLYIAMEFIDGETLSAWIKREQPDWRAILKAMLQAAQGLRAAHAADLVHRDFKPSNIMLDRKRARVMDFGLATLANEPSTESDVRNSSDVMLTGRTLVATMLTKTGVVMGTPAYMAPEQHMGMRVGPKADQFAFCGSLYFALYGVLPFEGKSLQAVAAAKYGGTLRPTPAGRDVPRWLQAIIERGLRPDPQDRYRSMTHLIAALRRGGRRGRVIVAGVAAVAIVAAGGTAWALSGPNAGVCKAGKEEIAAVWNPARRIEIGDAMTQAVAERGAATWHRVEPVLGAYADDWAATHRQACERNLAGEIEDETLDRSMACLTQRKGELGAVLDVLAGADSDVVDRSVRIATGLSTVRGCADDQMLASTMAPPSAEAAGLVSNARTQLAQAKALKQAGRYREGLGVAESVVQQARELGYAPLLAEALRRFGGLQYELGDYEESEATYLEAFEVASAARHDEMVADATIALVRVIGRDANRSEEAQRFANEARTAIVRLPDPGGREGLLLGHEASLLDANGKMTEAVDMYREAIGKLGEVYGHDSVRMAQALDSLGATLGRSGRADEAAEVLERSIELQTGALGEDHPDLVYAYTNLGSVRAMQGDYATAGTYFKRALSVAVSTFGAKHPMTGSLLGNLGSVAYNTGRFADAEDYERRGLAIMTGHFGEAHPRTAKAHTGLATALEAQGKSEEAMGHHRQALEVREQTLPPDHPQVALALSKLAGALARDGQTKRALELYERALTIREKRFGSDHPAVAWVLAGIGEAHVLAGTPKQGIGPLHRAVGIRERAGAPQHHLGEGKMMLARALWDSGRKKEAREHAEAARQAFIEFGDANQVEQIAAWLADRQG